MEELQRFTGLLFGDLQGIVYSPTKGTSWTEQYFEWPNQKDQLHTWIEANAQFADVYLSPVLYHKKAATKDAVKFSQVCWVEFDGDTEIDFRNIPNPAAIIQTSTSTHLHAYWRLDKTVTVRELEALNRRLTMYLRADSSGWDATQLLRPPDTYNHKYHKPLPVSVSHFSPGLSSVGLFDSAPEVVAPQKEIKQADLLPAKRLLLSLQLPQQLRRRINEETAPVGSRSSLLSKIALELAEEGLDHQQIVSLIHFVDQRIGKFAGRTDQLERYSSLAEFAILKVTQEDELQVLNIQEVLDHTETLEWIIEGWLHTSGFLILTSAPGVGKTQLALQFAVALISGQPFLGKQILGKDISVLILSLEMDFKQIKFVLRFQSNQWPENLDPKRIQVVDENGGLTTFENLIEQFRPSVVILDSLSELLEEGDNAREQSKGVMRWIRKIRRRYNCAVVAVHHNRKASEGNKKPTKLSDLYGSFHFARVVETVLCLWEVGQRIELSAIKTRFGPRDQFFIRRNANLMFERVDDADRKSGSDRGPTEGNRNKLGFGRGHRD